PKACWKGRRCFGSAAQIKGCRSLPGSGSHFRSSFSAVTRTQFCSRSCGRCTCRSSTLARFGTVTVGKSNSSKPGFYRFSSARYLTVAHFQNAGRRFWCSGFFAGLVFRSEEHTSELQSRENLVCRLLLEKKK